MDITYLGHSSFKIRSKNATIVTDPFDPKMVGLKFPKTEADIVLISHHHQDHDFVENFMDSFIVEGPGEYEVKGVKILGISAFHDSVEGAERGKNTVYGIKSEGLSLVHVGDLGHKLSDAQCEQLGVVDVLFIPVGGFYTIDAQTAASVVAQLEPKIVIPMHYRVPGLKEELAQKLVSVEEFLKTMGKSDVQAQDKLVISKDKLPEEMQVVVLK